MTESNNNAVFTQPPAQAGQYPAGVVAPREAIPFEVAPLLSRGLVYPRTSPLHMLKEVQFKAMTTREQNILTSRAYLKNNTVITELLKSSLFPINGKMPDPREMLIGDRTCLLVAIRISGYGNAYTTEVTCPACDLKSERQFDLNSLGLKRLEVAPCAEGENLFDFTLPKSKRVVQFRFLTGADEEEINTVAERSKRSGSMIDESLTLTLFNSIVSIEGESSRQKIRDTVNCMSAYDANELREYIQEFEPMIDMTQEITCSCGAVEEVTMPLGVNFLWPHARKRK